MQLDVVGLNHLKPDQRARFESVASQIVAESFVFTADRDYLTARFAFFEKQSHLFLWSAAQAIEKYLKANILLHGSGAITKTHELSRLAKSLQAVRPERLAVDTLIPDGWSEQGVAYWPTEDIQDFLSQLESWGAPNVRYNQNGFELNLQTLVLLDRLVFCLRDGLVEEKISECKYVGQRLLDCFLDLNFSFAPSDYRHPPLAGVTLVRRSVCTLEVALKGVYGFASLYETWAKQSLNMKEQDISHVKNIGASPYSS